MSTPSAVTEMSKAERTAWPVWKDVKFEIYKNEKGYLSIGNADTPMEVRAKKGANYRYPVGGMTPEMMTTKYVQLHGTGIYETLGDTKEKVETKAQIELLKGKLPELIEKLKPSLPKEQEEFLDYCEDFRKRALEVIFEHECSKNWRQFYLEEVYTEVGAPYYKKNNIDKGKFIVAKYLQGARVQEIEDEVQRRVDDGVIKEKFMDGALEVVRYDDKNNTDKVRLNRNLFVTRYGDLVEKNDAKTIGTTDKRPRSWLELEGDNALTRPIVNDHSLAKVQELINAGKVYAPVPIIDEEGDPVDVGKTYRDQVIFGPALVQCPMVWEIIGYGDGSISKAHGVKPVLSMFDAVRLLVNGEDYRNQDGKSSNNMGANELGVQLKQLREAKSRVRKAGSEDTTVGHGAGGAAADDDDGDGSGGRASKKSKFDNNDDDNDGGGAEYEGGL